jgi:transposase
MVSPVREHQDQLIAIFEKQSDATLAQYCELLFNATGLWVSQSTMCRTFQRLNLVRKKTLRSSQATCERVHTVWVDGGYDGLPFFKWTIDTLRWVILTVLRPTESKGFVLLRKRWKVERTFGWWNWCRRLSKDYESLPQSSETFLYLAMIRIMLRRLA